MGNKGSKKGEEATAPGHGHGGGGDDGPSPAPTPSSSDAATLEVTVPEYVFSKEELMQYNGRDPSKPIYLGCKGLVFDVTPGRDFYGPEGPYKNFAGRDASRALALMSLKVEDAENPSLEGLTPDQLKTLEDWEKKFKTKYEIMGIIGKYD